MLAEAFGLEQTCNCTATVSVLSPSTFMNSRILFGVASVSAQIENHEKKLLDRCW